jgi:hypothetical protein
MAEPIVMRLTTPIRQSTTDDANNPSNRLCFEVSWDGVDPDVWRLHRYAWHSDVLAAEKYGHDPRWQTHHAGVWTVSNFRGKGDSWLNYFAEAVHQYKGATNAITQHS